MPSDISGYGFTDDKFYESKKIKIPDVNERVKEVFFEVIIKGQVSLYKYEINFFVEKEPEGIFQLKSTQEAVVANSLRQPRMLNEYRDTLNMLMSDCEIIIPVLKNVKLNEKSLSGVVEAYNKCKNSDLISYKSNKPYFKATIGVFGGISSSNIKFPIFGKVVHYYLNGDFEGSLTPVYGIRISLSSPRTFERIALVCDIMYDKPQYFLYTTIEEPYVERNYVTINVSEFKIPFGIQYQFPGNLKILTIKGGFSNTFNINKNSSWINETERNNVIETNSYQALAIRNYQFGAWIGAGFIKSFKRFGSFLECRYEMTNGIEDDSLYETASIDSIITNFQIILGITLK